MSSPIAPSSYLQPRADQLMIMNETEKYTNLSDASGKGSAGIMILKQMQLTSSPKTRDAFSWPNIQYMDTF